MKKCGVHVFYVGAKSCADDNVESKNFNLNEMSNDESDSSVESSENSNLNEKSNDESDDGFYSAEDAIFEEANSDTQKRQGMEGLND